jgi:hypothetical protein
MLLLVDHLTFSAAPIEPVGRPGQSHHPDEMIFRIPAGVSCDNDVISGLEEVSRNTGSR